MKRNRLFAILTAVLLSFSLLTACAPTNTLPESVTEDSYLYTDSISREVLVPAVINRIAPSGTMAQIMLYTLCPEKMVGWGTPFSDIQKTYIEEQYTSLPAFGVFYGKNANLNLEALMAANPQIIIDIGEAKGSMAEDLNHLQETTGVPSVFVESTLEKTASAYLLLGDLLHCESQAALLAAYCDTTLADITENVASVPENERLTVYFGDGTTGLEAVSAGTIHSEVLEVLGLTNVADLGSNTNTEISMEQLLVWNPDVILLVTPEAYETATTSPLWAELSAVQNGKVYQTPQAPYNWAGRPPAVNRFLGLKWLGNLLYPALFDYDMLAETQSFYELFYHYELSEQEARELMANSTYAK